MLVTRKTYKEWSALWDSCHSPRDEKSHYVVMSWAKWIEDMIGPDNCLGFIIKPREHNLKGYWLSDSHNSYVPFVHLAKIYNWNDTAIKITNRRTLEAIRVDKKGVAQDSTGLVVAYFDEEALEKCGIKLNENSEVPKMQY